MNYAPQMQGRDRIAAALMEVQNPSPRLEMPQIGALGQGMNYPAMPTPGTVASMNAQSPASPSYGGVQALQGQPQAFPQQTQMAGAGMPPPTPGMQAAPGTMPSPPGAAEPQRY